MASAAASSQARRRLYKMCPPCLSNKNSINKQFEKIPTQNLNFSPKLVFAGFHLYGAFAKKGSSSI